MADLELTKRHHVHNNNPTIAATNETKVINAKHLGRVSVK